MAALYGIKTQQYDKPSPDNFTILSKNARGLGSDNRLEELLIELEFVNDWDILLISETWRSEIREFMALQSGHVFFGSGSSTARQGVAILLHQRWTNTVKQFIAVNERIAYLDLCLHSGTFRFVTTYFPHAGYADAHIERMYSFLSQIHAEATRRKYQTIIGGDFNAEVGSKNDSNNMKVIGQHGLNSENARG